MKRDFLIERLLSGGVITNYFCSSSCGHCLYCCSPHWEKRYLGKETLRNILEKIKSLRCTSIHIGGGEPFLNLEGLKMVVETTLSMGVRIEYVETNSSWYRDEESACRILSSLLDSGLSTMLVSIDPFHNECIPFYKVKGVLEACRATGMNVFPWIWDFFSEIDALDERATHELSEYEETYGSDYLRELPSRYWIHFGGRALKTFAPVFGIKPYREILSEASEGCAELLDVSHFHFDPYGNYIPGLCSGLAIECDDVGRLISQEKYPYLHMLFHRGVAGLFDWVSTDHGFEPSEGYMSKCHFCTELRRHLVLEKGINSADLQPKGFYAYY